VKWFTQSLTGLEKKSRVTTEKSAAVSAKPLVATRDSARRAATSANSVGCATCAALAPPDCASAGAPAATPCAAAVAGLPAMH
jgi:hypothetical protein